MQHTLIKKIGKQIQKLRLRKDLTQENLAEKSDMSVQYLSDIENGKRRRVAFWAIYKISEALRVSINTLIDDDEEI